MRPVLAAAVGLVAAAVLAMPAAPARATSLRPTLPLATAPMPVGAPITGNPASRDLRVDGASSTALVATGRRSVYLFAEPLGGWGSEAASAKLQDPAGGLDALDGVSVAGPLAVIKSEPSPGYGVEDVFTEPPGGWAGVLAPSARLTDTDGGSMSQATIASGEVFASSQGGTAGDTIDVFSKPVTGWTGTITETARLKDSRFHTTLPAAVTPSLVVAYTNDWGGTQSRVDVFAKPSGGWTGTIHQSATLETSAAPSGRAASGSPVLLIGDRLFAEPPRGWSGRVAPVAVIDPVGLQSGSGTAYLDGSVIVFTGAIHSERGHPCPYPHQCPFIDHAWLFREPPGGWSGTITALPALTFPGGIGVLRGNTLFSGSGRVLEVSRVDLRPRDERRLPVEH